MPMEVSSEKESNNSKKTDLVPGFLGGLNTFQDETLIKDSELTDAKNIVLDVDGIQPRPGTLNYGTDSNSSIQGSTGYYKSTGTREFLRVSAGILKKYVSTTPTAISGATFSTTTTWPGIAKRRRGRQPRESVPTPISGSRTSSK